MNKLFFILFIIFMAANFKISAQNATAEKWTVTLDAGHGGHDPGALGKRSQEKNIVLDIVLRVGKYLENHNDIKVVYTRKTDVFLKLSARTNIANKAKSDLFISVHCNASKNTTPSGTEVFVMGLDRSETNLEVAMQENSVALLEENYEENYGGINPNSAEAYIAFSMYQNMYLDRSLSFAQKVMKQMNSLVGLKDRGTKQGPFFVISHTTMPSVLIEAGFISNYSDETVLMSESGKENIAYAIYKAIIAYKNETTYSSDNIVDIKKASNNQVSSQVNNETNKDNNTNSNEVIFKIQFASFKTEIPLSDKRFKDIKKVSCTKINGFFKYFCGGTNSYKEISDYLAEIQKKGYKDAFIVAYVGGKQTSIKEARKLINE
ncbi:MAG: N-acetylmuramoyl-L-alanine amidase [Bacteroidales bacterium]|nr:N-acetylmuramoyl-L-alanine amidase [Bacteroidales bacterium]